MRLTRYDAEVRARAARRRLARRALDLAPALPAPREGPATRFVICGIGRNGSTLLVELLDANEGVRCEGELFQHWVWRPYAKLRRHLARCAEPVYGFKLLTYQIREVLGWADRAPVLDWLQAGGFRLVRVSRRDVGRHAISQINARLRGFHSTAPGAAPAPIRVAPDELRAWIDGIRATLEIEARLFAGRDAVEVVYEDDLATEAAQAAALARLGAALGAPLVHRGARLRKLVDPDLAQQIVNYDEILPLLEAARA